MHYVPTGAAAAAVALAGQHLSVTQHSKSELDMGSALRPSCRLGIRVTTLGRLVR